jgi:hypothetical protein
MVTLPEDALRYPVRMFIVVLFPAPFRPRRPTISPGPIENETPPSASFSP